eukprot:342524_1
MFSLFHYNTYFGCSLPFNVCSAWQNCIAHLLLIHDNSFQRFTPNRLTTHAKSARKTPQIDSWISPNRLVKFAKSTRESHQIVSQRTHKWSTENTPTKVFR